MSLCKKFPEGYDLSVLDASYHRKKMNQDTGKVSKDYMVLVYKDNITGKKYHEIIYEPDYRFYMLKSEYNTSHTLFYVSKDKLDTIYCKYTDLECKIAELTDNLNFFYDNIKAGNFRANKALHTIPRVLSSDVHIEDHYRARFAQEYKNTIKKIYKGYFDIEVNSKYMQGDFPAMGECPINAISYIDEKTNSLNVFLLRDNYNDNPLIQQFEDQFKNKKTTNLLFKELQEFIIDNVGGIEKAKKFGVDKLNINISFYDDEIQLLMSLFDTVNSYSPDFMMAWNMAFDMPYIIERCRALNVDPAMVLSDKNYKEKYADYYIDLKHKNDYELRGDYYNVAADTVYVDQLIQFASRRKGQSAFPDFKLDTAADIITKGAVRKLDYSHITTHIAELPYLDYKTFVFYNVMDVVAQKCIEESTFDIDYIYSVAINNDTRYSKVHRQTVYLANRARKFFYEKGYILGNNCNTGDSVGYEGALVGDPNHNSDYAKLKNGRHSYNVYDNLDDFDFKSLYPSIDREHNAAPDTIIGKTVIEQSVHKYENPYHNEMYDRGGQFIEDLSTCNPLEIGKRWLHLGSYREVLEDINEYYSTHIPVNPVTIYNQEGLYKPFTIHPGEKMMIRPINYLEPGELEKPFTIFNKDKQGIINSILQSNEEDA